MDYTEAQDLPKNEKVYLQKDMFGWRVVAPIKIDGKVNWFNLLFGGKRGLAFLIIVILMFGFYYLGTKELVLQYKKVADNPCSFCADCFVRTNADNQLNIPAEEIKGLIINDG